jgi:NADPH:quinone reductase-like Zn-dependent oxidoreductase
MSFEQAAAIPWQECLHSKAFARGEEIQPGWKTLLNGAGGGVGMLALQIAKSSGAHVTCVDGDTNLDMLRFLGADQVSGYMVGDYTESEECYDLILDVVATRTILAYRRSLTPRCVFVMIGGSMKILLQVLTLGAFFSKVDSRKLVILLHRSNRTDLNEFIRIVEAGKVVPAIDHRSPKLSGDVEILSGMANEGRSPMRPRAGSHL